MVGTTIPFSTSSFFAEEVKKLVEGRRFGNPREARRRRTEEKSSKIFSWLTKRLPEKEFLVAPQLPCPLVQSNTLQCFCFDPIRELRL